MPLEITPIHLFSPTLNVVPILELRSGRELSQFGLHTRRASGSTSNLPLLCWIGSPEVVFLTGGVRNREAPSCWCSELLQLHDLVVGAEFFIGNVCAGT